MRHVLPILFVSTILVACSKQEDVKATTRTPSAVQGGIEKSAGGIVWTAPKEWKELPAKSMRVATYGIPTAKGDSVAGECSVSFFGTGQGGDVESNIARWLSQFMSTKPPERSEREVNGLTVNLVDVTGIFLAPGGPMMQSQGKKENYRLLGAIVEAPEGLVFFKATGPTESLDANKELFDGLIGSITPQ